MAEATSVRVSSPSYQAFQVLHVALTVVPLVAGLDKFFHFLVNWDMYLSPLVSRTLGVGPHGLMLAAGVVEVLAAFVVAIAPRVGGWIVGIWLCCIIANLLSMPMYFDIALRDFGLALGAFALARLSVDYSPI
jgi:hypothetical protein